MSNRFANITQGLRQRVEQDAPPTEVVAGDDTTLSESETKALHYYEGVIERGLKTFFEVGDALTHVRDLRLYRVVYPTFEAYCAERWSMSRPQAYRLIDAAEVQHNLSPIGDILPTNEAQARPLAKLKDPEQQRQAWKQALDNADGRVTAGHVTAAVREVQGQNAPLRSAGDTEVIEGDVVEDLPVVDLPSEASGLAPFPSAPLPRLHGDDPLSRHVADLGEQKMAVIRQLLQAQAIIEHHQEHIAKARTYKPTSACGQAVAPLLHVLDMVQRALEDA